MITQKDIKVLELNETRIGKVSNWMLNLAPIFLTVICILNLMTANMIGRLEGYDLSGLLQSWMQDKDIEASAQYSGIYLKAMERVSTAMLQLGGAIVAAVLAYANQTMRKRNMRILETLRNSGVILN